MNTNINPIYDMPFPEHIRGFFDPEKTREWIHEKALSAFQKHLNKIESPAYRLKVTDLELQVPKKKPTYKEQNQAMMEKRDITFPLRGTFEMIDKKTGNVVDKKTTTIAHIPWLTDRNTTILNGSEYTINNQQRLLPGVYCRTKESGEVEAHVNVVPGTGVGGKVIFYPDRALFVYQVGTTQIKLYGLLKDLGVSDNDMEKAWGKDILDRNKALHTGNELDKYYSKVVGKYQDNE
jgi:DNA-directed RNA polymerase beta subunit